MGRPRRAGPRRRGLDVYVGIYFANFGSPELMLFLRSTAGPGPSWAPASPVSALAAGTTLSLTALTGSTLTFADNGTTAITATDTTLTGGAPGIMANGPGHRHQLVGFHPGVATTTTTTTTAGDHTTTKPTTTTTTKPTTTTTTKPTTTTTTKPTTTTTTKPTTTTTTKPTTTTQTKPTDDYDDQADDDHHGADQHHDYRSHHHHDHRRQWRLGFWRPLGQLPPG